MIDLAPSYLWMPIYEEGLLGSAMPDYSLIDGDTQSLATFVADEENPEEEPSPLDKIVMQKMVDEIKEKYKKNDTKLSFLPPFTPYIKNRFDHMKFPGDPGYEDRK